MAKILLVSQRLSPTVLRLATSLHEQQHQVTLLTSEGEDASVPDAIVVMRPFKTWSMRETLRLAPLLYMMHPQVIHLVLEEDEMKPAEIFISLMAKTIPNCVLSTSLLHIRRGLRRRNPVRYLLQESDVVTCSSVDALGALRGLKVRSRRQGRGLLPPVMNFQEDLPQEISNDASDLLRSLGHKKFLVIPFFEADFDDRKAFFRRLLIAAAHRHVLLLGSFSHWHLRDRKRFQQWMEEHGVGARWTLSGDLNPADQRRVLARGEALVMAGLSLSPLETTELFLKALQSGTNLIMDDRQSMIHADLWRHEESCWILKSDNVTGSLEELLSQGPLKTLKMLPESMSLHRDLVDGPLNELNRLYNKALSLKQNF